MCIEANKSFRCIERKLYPTLSQEASLEAWRIECCRLYNRALEHRIKAYDRRNETVTCYDQNLLLTAMRKRMPSVSSVPVWFARDALRRVDKSFKAFFRRCKAGIKKNGFPRFRSINRYKTMEFGFHGNYFRNMAVYVPTIGLISSRGRDAAGRQRVLRIVKRSDAWYAQVIVEVVNAPNIEPKTSIGIDVGLESFVTLSNGEKVENPRLLQLAARKLKITQRRACRKANGSKNRHKAFRKVARIHQRIKAQRKNFAYQTSRKLVNRFDLIGVEDLNIKGLASGMLAKSVNDAAWGLFIYCLLYKAASAGKQVVKVNPRGTSQECPNCGKIRTKSLSERRHQCECGLNIDRDHAAAVVIEARALEVTGHTSLRRGSSLPGNSCCSAYEPDEAGRLSTRG